MKFAHTGRGARKFALILLSLPDAAARRKILCLHGGGGTGASLQAQSGMASLVSDLSATYEFVFATAPYGASSSDGDGKRRRR